MLLHTRLIIFIFSALFLLPTFASAYKIQLVLEADLEPYEIWRVLYSQSRQEIIRVAYYNTVSVSNVVAPKDTYLAKFDGKLLGAELDATGKKLFIATESEVSILDLETRKKIWKGEIPNISTPVIITKNFNTIIHGTSFFNVETKNNSKNILHSLQSGSSLTPSNKLLVTSGFHDSRVMIWNVIDGKMLKEFVFEGWFSKKKFTGVYAFSEKLVFATINDGSADLIKLDNGEVVSSMEIGAEPAQILQTLDNKYVLVRSGSKVSVIDIANSRFVFRISIDEVPIDGEYNPETQLLCITTDQGNLIIYKKTDSEKIIANLEISKLKNAFVVSSRNGKKIIAVSNSGKMKIFTVED